MAGSGNGATPPERQSLVAATVDQALWDAEQAQADAKSNSLPYSRQTASQARLLEALGNPPMGYWQLTDAERQAVLLRVMRLIPRVGQAPNPREALEELLSLYRHPNPYEEMVKALRPPDTRDRLFLPSEEPYLRLGGWFGDFLSWSRYCDVPLGYLFWGGATALGAACRYNFFMAYPGPEPIQLNQYVIMVGTKATGKSTALNACLEVLRRTNYHTLRWHREHPYTPADWHRDHPWRIHLLPEDTNKKNICQVLAPRELDLIVPDGVELRGGQRPAKLWTDSCGLLPLDELGTFLNKDNFGVEANLVLLMALYGKDTYRYKTTAGGDITLVNAALSLLSCCTPGWMQQSITPQVFSGGFMDRTTLVYREPLRGRYFPRAVPRDPVMGNQLARFLRKLTCRLHREELYPDPEALEWYETWYRVFPEPTSEEDTSVKRMAVHLWKLAGLMCLSDDAAPRISRRHFEQALELLTLEESYYRTFRGILSRASEMDHMEFIERKLWKSGAFGSNEAGQPQVMLRSDLFNHLRQRKGLSPPNKLATPLLEALEQSGRVAVVAGCRSDGPAKGRGRTGMGYALTPAAVHDWRRRSGDEHTQALLEGGEEGADVEADIGAELDPS